MLHQKDTLRALMRKDLDKENLQGKVSVSLLLACISAHMGAARRVQCVTTAILLLDQSVQCHAGHCEASGSPE